MSESESAATGAGGLDRPLPEEVRQRIVELAAGALGAMPPADIPPPLRQIARFEPRRRARLGAAQIAGQLEADEDFRAQVAAVLREGSPELVGSIEEGVVPAAADPVLVAAAAYLLRPSGWTEMAEAARAELAYGSRPAVPADNGETVRLREQLAQLRDSAKADADRLREQVRSAKAENADLRRKLHEARERARAAEHGAAELAKEAEAGRAAVRAGDVEARRLRDRLAQAERQVEEAKRAVREGRNSADARLRVLLDTLADAASGLRRELALPVTIDRPADHVNSAHSEDLGAQALPARALASDDPALMDQLLALPQVHVIVDGYNVTKTGYGSLTLADQRARLVTGLGGLAAQSRVEVTCVFDGAEHAAPVSVPVPRGVRVLFSAGGESADDLIRHLVRAEPPGRPVVVISSDREVADSVRHHGARAVPATMLLRRLGRV